MISVGIISPPQNRRLTLAVVLNVSTLKKKSQKIYLAN